MVTVKWILSLIQPGDWFMSVDLKDAYFHVQISPQHSCFLRFSFEGVAYQFTSPPVRSVFSFVHIHLVHERCSLPSSSEWSTCCELFG